MADREKVIKGLETCTRPGMTICYHDSHECPYEGYGCRFQMEVDALALLKEQEQKQVVLQEDDEWYGPVLECPDCKTVWMSERKRTHYCPNCRRPVKWE